MKFEERRAAREALMQLLFQCEAQKSFTEKIREDFLEESAVVPEELDYFNSVWIAFTANRDAIDGMIEAYSNGWMKNRIGKVDLAVLRLCIAEIRFLGENSDVPVNSSVSEAVSLAKKYSDEKSGKFVNGILGRIARGEAPASKDA